MRLIDADKIIYMWQQDGDGKFHDGVTLESIVDNTPTVNINDLIIEELEKIKEEIQSIIALADSRGEDTKLAYQCKIVINERIAELKGE